MRFLKFTLIALVSFIRFTANGQSLPVGTPAIEDRIRRSQLLGNSDTSVSLTIRPIFPVMINKNIDTYYPDSTERRYDLLDLEGSWKSKNGKLRLSILPISWHTQTNTDHPYGWNDGAMIPAKGFQTVMSLGLFAEYGPLSVQFQPEFLNAANPAFSTWNTDQYDVIAARYYDIYNNIDLPARFGNRSFSRAYWGQSSIRLNYKGFSAGVSTENLWWGPGMRNSLLMSNTAPGFVHFTLNTTRPLKTALGSFEGQLIGGKLEDSGFSPLEPDLSYFGTGLYVPKPKQWRYLTGVIITWQPKWIPGLFLGYNQTSQAYGKNLQGITDYLPLFSSVKNTAAADQPIDQKDQLSSVFMRWLWPKEHTEVYFEFGHYNNRTSFLQAMLSPDNSRGYTFGIRKLLPIQKSTDENIMLGLEVTQLQQNAVDKIAKGESWYTSRSIRQGYTNRGEVLGAGIGPGANVQTFNVSWVKGLKRVGLQFERYVHNNDLYYYIFAESLNHSQHWVDLSVGALGEWNYKNFIFNAKLQYTNSMNYQWALKKNGNDIFFENQINKPNLQIQTGITYRF